MLKLIKKWINDWSNAHNELHANGFYCYYTAYGAYVHIINLELTQDINTTDDKP